jgi:serine/threonine protein kinase
LLFRFFYKDQLEEEFQTIRTLYTRSTGKYLVEVLRFGILDETGAFFDMELCSQPLSDFIRGESAFASGTFDANRTQIMLEISSGVEYIHGCHAVHRNLAPTNSNTFPYPQRLKLIASPLFETR